MRVLEAHGRNRCSHLKKEFMNWILELIKNPQSIVTVLAVLVLKQRFDDHNEKLERAEKEHEKTRELLKKHGEVMTDLTSQVLLLKAEVVKEIETLMAYISKVERNLERIEHNIALKTDRYEKASENISQLRDNIEDLYGRVNAIDITTTEARGLLALNKTQIEKAFEILKSYNHQIKEMKGQKR